LAQISPALWQSDLRLTLRGRAGLRGLGEPRLLDPLDRVVVAVVTVIAVGIIAVGVIAVIAVVGVVAVAGGVVVGVAASDPERQGQRDCQQGDRGPAYGRGLHRSPSSSGCSGRSTAELTPVL